VDNVEHYQLWRETRRCVSGLQRSVESGERVSEAINFARYLQWSGILRLCKGHRGEEIPEPLKTDGGLLEWETSELLQLALRVPESQRPTTLEEKICKNLDVIAGHIQRNAPPVPASATASTVGGAP